MGSLERVFTGTECREIDRIAIEELGISGFRLMYRAASFAMAELLERWSNPKSVSIVCGSGNNAGDGYLLAGALQARQIPVQIVQVGDASRLRGDAKRALESITELGLMVTKDAEFSGEVIVDALLGTGARGEVRPAFAEAIDRINAAEKPVLALDLPSGIDADTGGFLMEEPVRADLTTCFVGRKVALATGKARNVAGEVVTSLLEIPEEVFQRVAGLPVLPTNDGERALPERLPSSHKRHFGHVLIVGGNRGMGGAVLLAGEACLRSGAGLVSVITHPDHAGNLLTRRPELMVRGSADGQIDPTLLGNVDLVAIGPGLGVDEWARSLFAVASASKKPMVVDADALNLLAEGSDFLPPGSVVTPHPGEAARLLDTSTASIEADRIGAVRQLTAKIHAVGVLKGAGSLVANDGQPYAICDVAEPSLSTAGSGDVLTGVIAATYAQLRDPLRATALGVHLHALAGQRARALSDGRGVIAGDLIDALRPWG